MLLLFIGLVIIQEIPYNSSMKFGPEWRDQDSEITFGKSRRRPKIPSNDVTVARGGENEDPINVIVGRAAVDNDFRAMLFKRPGIAVGPYLTNPWLKVAIDAIRTDNLQDFVQLARQAETMLKASPDMPLDEITRRVTEASDRMRQARRNPPQER